MPNHNAKNVITVLKVTVLEESSADKNKCTIHSVRITIEG